MKLLWTLLCLHPLPPPRLQARPRLVLTASWWSSHSPLFCPQTCSIRLHQVTHSLQSSLWVLGWRFMLQFMPLWPHLLSIFQKMVCQLHCLIFRNVSHQNTYSTLYLFFCLMGSYRFSKYQHLLDHQKSKRVPEKHIFLLYWLCRSLRLCGSQ